MAPRGAASRGESRVVFGDCAIPPTARVGGQVGWVLGLGAEHPRRAPDELRMLMVRENTHGRIERAGVSDARKAHFDPLAKQAGEKCAL